MANPLHVLLLEDDAADAKLIAQELLEAGFVFDLTRIQSEADLRHELESGITDLILSDHGLPAFDGFKALQIVRATRPELPFIFVSDSNNQGMVARMYEEGATDYVFKRDVGDLSPAVRRALEAPPGEPLPVLPPESPPPPPSGFARLHFCPDCSEARDESGGLVDFWDYFRSHAEIVVLRECCWKCNVPKSPG